MFILCVWAGHQHYHDSQSVRTKFKLHNLSCVWVQNKLVSWCYMTSVDCKPGKTGTLGFNTGLSLNWQAAHNTSLTWFFLSCQDKVARITMIPGCLTWTKKKQTAELARFVFRKAVFSSSQQTLEDSIFVTSFCTIICPSCNFLEQ